VSLPAVRPEEAGLDPARLSVADAIVRAGVEDGTYPAAVLLVARRGQTAHVSAFGTIGTDGRPALPDTIFDLASLTKPCVAAALLTLVEDGRLSPAQTAQEWLPEADGTAVGKVTLRQLATHVSGLPPWKPLYEAGTGREAMLAEILRTPLRSPPGAKYAYSDLGYILLGEIVERAGGMALSDCLRVRVLEPMSMKDTGYLPDPSLRSRIAPTANCPMRPGRVLLGEAHDANAHYYGGVGGHAGLFGTAPDLAAFAVALCGDRQADGHRLLGLPALRQARANQLDPDVGGHSIGWFTPPNEMLPRGDLLSDAAFGHTGFTGTMVVCDLNYDLVLVLLTNRVMNPADNAGILRIRRRVVNAVASAVVQG
jgi:CubicO group peptidase (beta-lactamase class C family)